MVAKKRSAKTKARRGIAKYFRKFRPFQLAEKKKFKDTHGYLPGGEGQKSVRQYIAINRKAGVEYRKAKRAGKIKKN